jgi:hypothetical protein
MRKAPYLVAVALVCAVGLVTSCGKYEPVEEDLPALDVFPDSADIEVCCARTFYAGFEGRPHVVVWSVDGVAGGSPPKGIVTKAGTYVAPAAVPAGGRVTVHARSLEDPTLEGTSTLRVRTSPSNAFVTIYPDTATVLASGNCFFTSTVSGCGTDSTIWSLELVTGVATAGLGSIGEDGAYEAPATSGDNFEVLIRATSAGCLTKSGIAKVRIPAEPRTFSVELEDYDAKFNVPGSEKIRVEQCSHASSGEAVAGLDRNGEYIEVPMHVRGAGRYIAYVTYAAAAGTRTWLRLEAEGCGSAGNTAGFTLDEGEGTT